MKKLIKKLKNIKINKKYLILIGFIAILFLRSQLLKKPNDQLTYTVTKETLVNTVQVSGTYTTAAQTEVISPSKGIITELYVENNEQVEIGTSLFHVESTATTEEKAAAYASYQSSINTLKISKQNKENFDAAMWAKQKALLDAQNNLDSMNNNLLDDSDNPATNDKYTELEINSIKTSANQTKKDFQAAEKQYKEADTAIGAAQATVTSSKLSYDATKNITVKAPANGKVVNLLKKIGDGVDASTATKIATPVLIVANLNNPSITAKVSETNISHLVEGQKAEIVFDADRDQTFTGYIEAIDTVGTNTAGIVTYDARITIEDITPNIKPNMTGIITVETLRKENVFSVPNSAILYQDGKIYLKKANKEKNNLIEVELGVKGIVKTEIINGLSEDLEVVANISSN